MGANWSINNHNLIMGPVGITTSVVVGIVSSLIIYKLLVVAKTKTSSSLIALVDPQVKYAFRLVSRTELTHDTRRFRFALPSAEHTLGLKLGQHVNLSARINKDLVVRTYTPTSHVDDKGHFEIVIKVYKSGVHSKFPNGGKMSQHLDSLKVGDTIDVRGPSGRLVYNKHTKTFEISAKNSKSSPVVVRPVKQIGMIAGGTGITPMFQLINDICGNSDEDNNNSKPKLQLLFANHTEEDILLFNEIEEFATKSNGQLKTWYTVSNSTGPGWNYDTGRVNEKMFVEHLPPPGNDTLILLCGPAPMINLTCVPQLEKLGFTKEMLFIC